MMWLRGLVAITFSALILFGSPAGAYNQLHLCNGSGRRYCANTQRALRCPETCRPQNCAHRPSGKEGMFYTRCSQIRPPVCQTIYWEEIAATNMYDYIYLNTTMDQKNAEVCMSTCREEPFRGICLASERGVNGVDYCKQIDCRRLKMPNQSGCHQPRDFHAPTCFECEVLFPLACGSNAGGVLKGWKTRRDDIIKQRELKESIKYNASVVDYSKMVDSTFEDTFRWLNGVSVPQLPAWYTCAKMNADRVQYVESLAQQKRNNRDKAKWLAGDTPILGKPCASSDCPQNKGESSDFLNGLTSSEALPHATMWETNRCKMHFPDALKMYDSEYNEKRSDDDDTNNSEDVTLEVDGTLDFLPPWIWEPWNQDWEPLPKGMKWYWETIEEAELSVAAAKIDTDSTVFVDNVIDELDKDVLLANTSGSATAVLTTSAVLAFQAPELIINSGQNPTVVQVIFQVSDTAASPYNDDDEEAVKHALAFVADYKHTAIELDVEKDFTQDIATISANVFTNSPVEVSVAFNKADRDGRFAASMAGADLEYLEVSMTTAVTYAGSGFIDINTVEALPASENGESDYSEDLNVKIAISCASGIALLLCVAGCVYLRFKLLSSGQSSQAADPVSPSKETVADSADADGSSIQMTGQT